MRLKNGSEEFAPAVAVIMLSLRRLFDTDPMTAYEAVMLARDRDHVPFGECGKRLAELSIATPPPPGGTRWSMHETPRAVILSAVEGDGLDMTISPPVSQ